MRITGGHARGIALSSPKSTATRPATDRMREAVFSSLGQSISGQLFLDLFAGTGSYGLEALSRGAQSGVFVESDRQAVAAIKQNLQAVCKSIQQYRALDSLPACIRSDVLKFQPAQRYALVFLDPPYPWTLQHSSRMLRLLSGWVVPAEDSRVVFELPAGFTPDLQGWQQLQRIGKSGKGDPSVLLLQPAAAGS